MYIYIYLHLPRCAKFQTLIKNHPCRKGGAKECAWGDGPHHVNSFTWAPHSEQAHERFCHTYSCLAAFLPRRVQCFSAAHDDEHAATLVACDETKVRQDGATTDVCRVGGPQEATWPTRVAHLHFQADVPWHSWALEDLR